MSQEWMIDVLTDLKDFARRNGLMGLAEQLDDTILVAVTELRCRANGPAGSDGHAGANSCVPRTLAAGDNL